MPNEKSSKFDAEKLTPAQEAYVREHALDLWRAMTCEPSDSIEAILASTCHCCEARRAIVLGAMNAK